MKKNNFQQTALNNSKGTAQNTNLSNDELRGSVMKEWTDENRHRFQELITLFNNGTITDEEYETKRQELLKELENALKDAGVKGQRCSITGETHYSYGNNAYPFSGRCSDYANSRYVIPARLEGVNPDLIKQLGGNRNFARIMDMLYYNE